MSCTLQHDFPWVFSKAVVCTGILYGCISMHWVRSLYSRARRPRPPRSFFLCDPDTNTMAVSSLAFRFDRRKLLRNFTDTVVLWVPLAPESAGHCIWVGRGEVSISSGGWGKGEGWLGTLGVSSSSRSISSNSVSASPSNPGASAPNFDWGGGGSHRSHTDNIRLLFLSNYISSRQYPEAAPNCKINVQNGKGVRVTEFYGQPCT